MELIYGLAALQGLVFVAFLLFQKKQRTANYLLAAYILMISFTLTISYLNETGLLIKFPFLIGLDAAVPYLCGPFLWIYVCLVTSNDRRLGWKDVWHLIPFLGHSFYVFFTIIIQPEAFKIGLVEGSTQVSNPLILFVSNTLKTVHAFIYYYFTFRRLKHYENQLSINASQDEMVQLRWLRWLMVLIMSVSVIMFMGVISFVTLPWENVSSTAVALINVFLFVLVYAIGFFALKYPQLFHQLTPMLAVQGIGSEKYAQSTLSAQESQEEWTRLKGLMEMDKPFSITNLTIADLAERMGKSTKSLSQIINENSGQNFFNFINSYRINEFKNKAVDPTNAHLTLMAIASECGFASKSSFHSIFKKHEGCTPRQFLQQQGIETIAN